MAITKVGDYISSALQKAQDATSSRTSSEDKTASARDVSTTSDKVEISKGAQEMAKVSKVATDGDDIRTEVVDRVRSMIDSGNYSVSPDKVAAKMMEEVW
jgi:flagellar biosynthesis anti-sigma factor FlgM